MEHDSTPHVALQRERSISVGPAVDRAGTSPRIMAMQPSFARNAIVLGLLSAIGPFAIDMYLPALPSIAADLEASTAATQMSLMAFFAAFGLCQVVYGPISDMIGRRPPLYFGLSLFAAGSVGCSLAPSIEWLIVFRSVQGIGACASMVIPRAIVRDLHTGIEATRLMSLIMLVFSVAPILAPLTGSGLIAAFSWRATFVAMTLAGFVGLALVTLWLPETRPPEKRVSVGIGSVVASYGQLLRDGYFLGVTFIGGFGMASFFAFLATSSFVYIDHFGLTPTQYSFAFSVNAVGFIGSAQFSARLVGRLGMRRLVAIAVSCYAALALLLFALTLAGSDSLAVIMVLLFAAFACLGLVVPTTAVLALDPYGRIAGAASALMGTLQMVAGAAAITVVSVFFDGTALPMVAAIALCALAAFVLSRLALAPPRAAAAPAE
jgi:DHA1 family bicyclomycin/chloramphenicol resistance-like MFS transporter